MALEKAKLTVEREGASETFQVQFNPSEYNLSESVNYAEKNIPGTAGPITQFVSGASATLSLSLTFDTYDTPENGVRESGGKTELAQQKQHKPTDVSRLTRRVANLVAIHQKTDIGRLSAFCGAVSAATGAVAGIAYMEGASYDVIAQTIVNSIANVGGMVCDGAKSSCAGKIASALESAFLGYELAKQGRGFFDGEGIVKADVEATIASVGRMASAGMLGTDKEILNIMIDR